MATEKIGIYRRWLEPVPIINGKPIPKSEWPKKRNHCWAVRWFGTTGKRYSKNFKTKKLADNYARNLQEQVNAGKPDRPNKITLRDFIKEHEKVMKGQVAHATLYEQVRALKLFEKFIGGSTNLSNIKPIQAEAFVAKRLSSDISTETANKDIRTLKSIFNIAIEPRGYLKEGQNPFRKIKQRKKTPKSIHYIPVSDYHKLVNSTASIWWKSFISIAYCCGFRRNEILNLTWPDIDFENQMISVAPKKFTTHTIEWEPKDHESRTIPMPDQTSKFLAELQSKACDGMPYLFIPLDRLMKIKKRIANGIWDGRFALVNNLLKDYRKICEKAEISKCCIHDLRRSAITNWAQHLPIQVVQQFAGHSNIATTKEYYLSVTEDNMTFANNVMNRLLESENTTDAKETHLG